MTVVGVWQRRDANVVALHRLDQGLGHSVRLRALDWRRPRLQANVAGHGIGFVAMKHEPLSLSHSIVSISG